MIDKDRTAEPARRIADEVARRLDVNTLGRIESAGVARRRVAGHAGARDKRVAAGSARSKSKDAAALALAARIASRAPLSVEATKAVAGRAPDLAPEDSAAFQAPYMRRLTRSEDHREALAAFRDKRDPVFNRR